MNNSQPLISVITPVFNNVHFIRKCIENVISQNCSFAEHIVLDAQSDDGTVEIAREYAGKYEHLTLISEKDQGQSDAMNKGIQLAKGEILGFLNVDDYYEQGVLNRVAEIAEKNKSPFFIYGNCNIWDEDIFREVRKQPVLTLPEIIGKKQYPPNSSGYFYHKSLHNEIGEYDKDNHMCMDLDIILKLVTITKPIYFDETWGNFRVLEGTKTYRAKHSQNELNRTNELLHRFSKNLDFAGFAIVFYYRLLTSMRRIAYYLTHPMLIRDMVNRKFRS